MEEKIRKFLGRKTLYKINSTQEIVYGLHYVIKDLDLPVNLAASVFMKTTTDFTTWTYKHIECILQTGYRLYVESHKVLKPNTSKLGIEHVLRCFRFKDCEAKIEIKKPIPGRRFTRESLYRNLILLCTFRNFCIVNFDEYYVSIYFKGLYYYLFDPYRRDLYGNRTEKGTAVMMRFKDLAELVDKVVGNLLPSGAEVVEGPYSLISVILLSVARIGK